MLARILLYGCSGEGEVARRLRAIGFDVKRPPTVRIPGNLLALNLLGVIAIFVAMALVTSQSRGGLDLTGALLLGLQVAIGHCIAASFALLPKQIFGFADIRCSGERPFLWYVIFALVAALCVLPVSFVFNELRMQLAISRPSHAAVRAAMQVAACTVHDVAARSPLPATTRPVARRSRAGFR